MIVGAHATSPRLNEVFAEYTQARGIFVDPARVRKPRDKSERSSATSRTRATVGMRARPHASRSPPPPPPPADWRRSAASWCRDISRRARPRHDAQGATRRSICSSKIIRDARSADCTPFDVPSFAEAKVHPDQYIASRARALLGAPTMYLGKRVRVRLDSKTVRLYLATELIKMHPRQEPGGRATDPHDYPAGKSIYALRNVDALKKKAQERGAHGRRVRRAFARWSTSMDADALCVRADLALRKIRRMAPSNRFVRPRSQLDCVDVKRISRMLKLGLGRSKSPRGDNVVQLRLPIARSRFERNDADFRTRKEISR